MATDEQPYEITYGPLDVDSEGNSWSRFTHFSDFDAAAREWVRRLDDGTACRFSIETEPGSKAMKILSFGPAYPRGAGE